MKTLAIGDSYPAHPRLKKISRYFAKIDNTDFLLWNRDQYDRTGKENEWIFDCPSAYGKKIEKLKNIVYFRSFIKRVIQEHNYERIICRQWQVLLVIRTLSLNSQTEIIYDVCDMPSNRVVRWFESRWRQRADKIVLASRFFVPYYQKEHGKVVVLENRPMRSENHQNILEASNREIVRLTFLGRIRYGDLLEKLIDVIKNEDILFSIYGTGPDEKMLKRYVDLNGIENVVFYGAYEEKEIGDIYAKSDVIWAAYDDQLFNVKRAISNKFFETLVYKKPGIFSQATDLANLIQETNIGLVVNPHRRESMSVCIKMIKDPAILKQCQSELESWPDPLYFDSYLESSPYLT